MEFCTSKDWKEILEKLILPGAFRGVDLGPTVVEIGPGPGFTTEVLLRSAAHVRAVEIDPDLAHQLEERLPGTNLDVVLGDARHLPFPSASATGAASFHMLHHVPSDADQDRIFAELHRVLRPGGTLLLADSFGSNDLEEFHAGDVYNPIDIDTLSARLADIGYIAIQVTAHDLGWYCTASTPGASESPLYID
jgi:SAM-dependent methyltransferase